MITCQLFVIRETDFEVISLYFQSDSLDLTNKLVFDRDDPNRPRFTMTELKEILYERNELKARVSDLEDELEMYRPKEERQYVMRESLFHSACNMCAIVTLIQLTLFVARLILACLAVTHRP